MRKIYFLMTSLALVIAGAGLIAFSRSQSTSQKTNSEQNVNKEKTNTLVAEANQSTTTSQASIQGVYKDYNQNEISTTKGVKLIFFHAPWCPQCRSLDESIKSSVIPENTTIFKVDYDSNQDLRKKYGVTLQTTFVKVNDNGEKIGSYVAYQSPTFQNVSNALLR